MDSAKVSMGLVPPRSRTGSDRGFSTITLATDFRPRENNKKAEDMRGLSSLFAAMKPKQSKSEV